MRDLLLLGLTCAKAGTLAFGGGAGMIPLLHADVVTRYGWLSEKEFLDAVALGHVTPGPVMIAATFMGWKVAGLAGAVVATLAIFSPSAIMCVLVSWQLARVRNSPWVRGFLAGIQPAVVGMVGAVALQLARAALLVPARSGLAALDAGAVVWCLLAMLLLVRYQLDAALMILLGALWGLAWYS
jgi:chromate transporter